MIDVFWSQSNLFDERKIGKGDGRKGSAPMPFWLKAWIPSALRFCPTVHPRRHRRARACLGRCSQLFPPVSVLPGSDQGPSRLAPFGLRVPALGWPGRLSCFFGIWGVFPPPGPSGFSPGCVAGGFPCSSSGSGRGGLAGRRVPPAGRSARLAGRSPSLPRGFRFPFSGPPGPGPGSRLRGRGSGGCRALPGGSSASAGLPTRMVRMARLA